MKNIKKYDQFVNNEQTNEELDWTKLPTNIPPFVAGSLTAASAAHSGSSLIASIIYGGLTSLGTGIVMTVIIFLILYFSFKRFGKPDGFTNFIKRIHQFNIVGKYYKKIKKIVKVLKNDKEFKNIIRDLKFRKYTLEEYKSKFRDFYNYMIKKCPPEMRNDFEKTLDMMELEITQLVYWNPSIKKRNEPNDFYTNRILNVEQNEKTEDI